MSTMLDKAMKGRAEVRPVASATKSKAELKAALDAATKTVAEMRTKHKAQSLAMADERRRAESALSRAHAAYHGAKA